jgi:hypothetical protein
MHALHFCSPGKPVSISIAGGSVSQGVGAGLTLDDKHTYSWVALLRDWLAKEFPNSKTSFHNGAQPAR